MSFPLVLHPTLLLYSGNPGQPVTMMLSVIGRKGPSSVTVGKVSLVSVSGPDAMSNSTMTDMGNGDILVTADVVPKGEFLVILEGTDKVSNSEFQRQSTTQMSVSKVNFQVCRFTSSSQHVYPVMQLLSDG